MRRRSVAYGAAVLGVAVVTAVAAPFVERLSDTTVALAYLLVVLLVAARWGSRPAFVASLVAMLAFNFFFLPPLYEFTIADPRNWVALAAFLTTAVIAGQLSERARRRAAEAEAGREAARRAAAYDRSLLEASLDAMVAIGHDGKITDVNGAAERLTGRSRAELIGTEFASCFTDPRRASVDHHEALRGGVVRNSTLAIRHRDERTIPVLSNASAYRDDRGEVGGVFVVARELEGLEQRTVTGYKVHEPEAPPRRPLPPAPPVAQLRESPAETKTVERTRGRLLLAVVPPVVTAAVQFVLWPILQPFAWFLFYPAIFISAWIGRLRGGLLATAVATGLAWWLFVPPERVIMKAEPRYIVPALAFAATGFLFSVLRDRLHAAFRAASDALIESRAGAERLARANDEIARLVEQASDGIFVADCDGHVTDVNRAGCQLTGFDREKLVGQLIGDLLAPEEAARFRRIGEIRDGGVQIAEYRLRRKDAADLPVEVSAKILPDGRWQAIARDITERKQAEAALSESEANLNRAQAVAHIGSWYLDVSRDRLAWSNEVFRMFAIPAGTPLTYEAFLGMVHPDDRKRVEHAWAAALNGAPYDIEHRIVLDGSEKWVRERAEVEFDDKGVAVAGIGTVQDITDRKRAELELARIHRAQRALSHCNQVLVRATDETELLGQICRIAVDDAGYRFCWVGRAEQDDAKSVTPIAQAGFGEGYLERARITWADVERGRGPTGIAIREHRVVVSKDIATDPTLAPWRADALKLGYASSIAIPLTLDSTTYGALMIYASEPGAFGDQEVALLSELASDLSYGIATLRTRVERDRVQTELRALNTELEQRVAARTAELRAARERENETAGHIQQTLLLDVPPRDIRGLQVAAVTVPSHGIAGDFYGFFHHEANDCLDVLIADVMGKGIPAALLGAATKSHFPEAMWHLMAESVKGALPEPKEIVTLAHTRMARHLIGLESFVTSCYARFDVARRTIALVDCGHTGAVLFRAAMGTCTILRGENLPLGVRENEIYEQLVVPFEVGDSVVLFSDGVTETRDTRGELFGYDRLIECIRQHAAADPATLVAAIRDATAAFGRPRTLADDLTCVVVQMIPHEIPLAREEFEVRSEPGELRRARELVTTFCARLSPALDEDRAASLVLAVDEAASNVMRHAHRGKKDQRIHIAIEAFRDHVGVVLRYLGAAFDPSAVPPPAFDGSRESGFGVFLISRSADAVRYYRDDLERNSIYLEKRR